MQEDASKPTGGGAAGDPAASAGSLIASVYDQLRHAAARQIALERAGHTLSATALVHEAFLAIAGGREVPWQNRAHFYGAAAEAMRRVLLDHAKARGRLKRGGGGARVDLEAGTIGIECDGPGGRRDACPTGPDFIALDSAIRRLGERDPRAAEVVGLRFYAGLGNAEAALALGVSERTVKNDWAFARAWLMRELGVEGRSPPPASKTRPPPPPRAAGEGKTGEGKESGHG
jgi:RNA polymerase sigma factor (TIGR02999 family)